MAGVTNGNLKLIELYLVNVDGDVGVQLNGWRRTCQIQPRHEVGLLQPGGADDRDF